MRRRLFLKCIERSYVCCSETSQMINCTIYLLPALSLHLSFMDLSLLDLMQLVKWSLVNTSAVISLYMPQDCVLSVQIILDCLQIFESSFLFQCSLLLCLSNLPKDVNWFEFNSPYVTQLVYIFPSILTVF